MKDGTQKEPRKSKPSDMRTIPKVVNSGNRKSRRALAAQLRARKGRSGGR
jgi:hypothetical protein